MYTDVATKKNESPKIGVMHIRQKWRWDFVGVKAEAVKMNNRDKNVRVT